MHLQAGGRHLLLQTYDKGQIILQDLASKECRQLTDGELYLAIHLGQVLCRDAALQDAEATLGSDALTRLQARGATESAIIHASAKLQWISALAARGITRLVDEPFVRVEIARLAKDELKNVKRFTISTLYEADLQLRKTGGDVCALVPQFDMRGGRGQWRIAAPP
jgi:hypothetical protein